MRRESERERGSWLAEAEKGAHRAKGRAGGRLTAQLIRHAPNVCRSTRSPHSLAHSLGAALRRSDHWPVSHEERALFDLWLSWRMFCVFASIMPWPSAHCSTAPLSHCSLSLTLSVVSHIKMPFVLGCVSVWPGLGIGSAYLHAFCLTDLWFIFIYIFLGLYFYMISSQACCCGPTFR